MEKERKMGVLSLTNGDQFGATSEVKVENEEDTSLWLSQWLQPSQFPLSYLALLSEESSQPDEKLPPPPPDYVVKKVILPSRDAAAPGGGIRTLYSASESDGSCLDHIGSPNVKPSIRVQSRSNNDLFGSISKVPVGRRSARKPQSPSSRYSLEGSNNKDPMFGQPSRKSERSPSQNYSEKLRSWKEGSNRNNNRGFSQRYGKYRDVPSKQCDRYKKAYIAESERKQRIMDNINALGDLLPHEVEDTPESILNDVIAHVKLLQLQMKELTRTRLGGEPITHHMIPLEGYGHFIKQEGRRKMTKPLEEIIGDVLANDPEAAAKLLESKGLYLKSFSSLQGFC